MSDVEAKTKFEFGGINVFNRPPAMMDQLDANAAKFMAQEEEKRIAHDMLLRVAENLKVDSRSPFLEIPVPEQRENARRAMSMRTAHGLFFQAYEGMAQACGIISHEPSEIMRVMKKFGNFKRGAYQGIPTALVGLSHTLYPEIDFDTSGTQVYTAFGGLGLLRVTAPDDYKTFALVENALSYVLRVPITERIYINFKSIFDGGKAVNPLLIQWNHVQNYPQYLDGNEIY